MIKLYTSASCTSCRKAKSWLIEHGIEYKEINVVHRKLTIQELQEILRMTEAGIDEVVSRRSKIYQELGLNMEELTVQKLLQIIREYPTLLKRPILIDEKRIQVGFHEEEIRRFLPRPSRRKKTGATVGLIYTLYGRTI